MVNIRDYKYKIIGENTLLGIELESKGGNYYNNKINVKFLNGEELLKEEIINVPFLGGDNIYYAGCEYNINLFTDIKLELELGEETFEESYYPDVVISLDKEKSSQRHLEYKIENNSTATFNEAKLNLLFYNRGELVCGTNIKLDNVMNGRAYYFTYDIPEEITYTDINTELFIPNTNTLLFRGFYYKYINYLSDVDDLKNPLPHKAKMEYYDKNPEIQKLIEETKKSLKDAKKIKTGKFIPIYILYKTLLYVLLGAIVGVLCVIGYIILLVIGSVFLGKLNPNETTALIIAGIGCFITVAIMWGVNISDGFIKITKSKEKEETIKMALDTIAEGEAMIQKNIANKDADIKQVEEDNIKIEEENKKIDEENGKRVIQLKNLLDEFSAFKEKYSNYMVIENYDDVDKSLIDVAIEDGAITFDSVELYRKAAREKIDADEKFKQEMAMRQKEVQAQQAQTQAIKASTLQSSIDAQLMRQEVQRQTQAQNQAIYAQMAQADKLYKQKEYYGRQVTARLDELRYDNYLNSKYL